MKSEDVRKKEHNMVSLLDLEILVDSLIEPMTDDEFNYHNWRIDNSDTPVMRVESLAKAISNLEPARKATRRAIGEVIVAHVNAAVDTINNRVFFCRRRIQQRGEFFGWKLTDLGKKKLRDNLGDDGLPRTSNLYVDGAPRTYGNLFGDPNTSAWINNTQPIVERWYIDEWGRDTTHSNYNDARLLDHVYPEIILADDMNVAHRYPHDAAPISDQIAINEAQKMARKIKRQQKAVLLGIKDAATGELIDPGKPGPKPKYKTDEERKAAMAAQRKARAQKRKQDEIDKGLRDPVTGKLLNPAKPGPEKKYKTEEERRAVAVAARKKAYQNRIQSEINEGLRDPITRKLYVDARCTKKPSIGGDL